MKKKILSSILSLVFVFSIIASAVIIFPQNAKSEDPPNSLNWDCSSFKSFDRICSDETHVIYSNWAEEPFCCPEYQDLCPED